MVMRHPIMMRQSHRDAMIPRDDPVSRRSNHWYNSDQVTEIYHRLQPADLLIIAIASRILQQWAKVML